MAELHIRHAFVSTKPDNPDSSLVSSSEWNASNIASGGSHGQIIVRDGFSSTGLSLADGAWGNSQSSSYSGAAPSPATMAETAWTFTSPGFIFIWMNTIASVSDGSTVTAFIKRNNVLVSQYALPGNGMSHTRAVGFQESVGTHVYNVAYSLASGTFTALAAQMVSLKLGAL